MGGAVWAAQSNRRPTRTGPRHRARLLNGDEPKGVRRRRRWVRKNRAGRRTEVPLLDEVLHLEALVHVALGDRDDEPQVAHEHPLARRLARPQQLPKLTRLKAHALRRLFVSRRAAEALLQQLLLGAELERALQRARELELLLRLQQPPVAHVLAVSYTHLRAHETLMNR
eukprot:2882128-Prymnesium_polylepis.1